MRISIRFLVSFAALGALVATAFAASAWAAGISVSPTSGAIGTNANVSGNGFAANASVQIFFNGSGGTLVGTETTDGAGNLPAMAFLSGEGIVVGWDQPGNQVATATSNGNGAFATSFSTPSGGAHTVFATGQTSHFQVTTTLNGTGNATSQNVACSNGDADDSRPGNGFGDRNHCHTGPPGHPDNGDHANGNHGKQGDQANNADNHGEDG
jgi:hypothetical protein